MKQQLLIWIIATLTLTGCYTISSIEKKDTRHLYQSVGNDVAFIKLDMKANNRFLLEFKPLDKEMEKVKFKGKWKTVDGKYKLTFKGDGPDTEALFPSNHNNVEVESNSFSFDSDKKSLWIWGVSCQKQ